MPRIPDQDRLGVVDAHIGHWQQADAQQAMPIEIMAGYGVAQLQTDRDAYHAKQEEVAQLESDLAAARAERDGIFGLTADDDGGAWFRLRQYKTFVRARLGARHPLSRTVPSCGGSCSGRAGPRYGSRRNRERRDARGRGRRGCLHGKRKYVGILLSLPDCSLVRVQCADGR